MSSDPSQVILPRVLLILPVQEAVFDLADEQWDIHRPFGVYSFLPPGTHFPFRTPDVWVYTQLQGGLGSTELAVEFGQRTDEDENRVSYRSVGVSVPTQIDFDPQAHRLSVSETAFHFRTLPFREEGTYEFRVYAILPDGTEQPLNGPIAEMTVLHPQGRV